VSIGLLITTSVLHKILKTSIHDYRRERRNLLITLSFSGGLLVRSLVMIGLTLTNRRLIRHDEQNFSNVIKQVLLLGDFLVFTFLPMTLIFSLHLDTDRS
jgi:uncharacterized membrane protein SpoIIM required for sporulation